MDIVRQAKEHIVNGDIFQIVLSQRFEIQNPPDSFDVYRKLRVSNPSPYLYYFHTPTYDVAGVSPEMLASVKNGTIHNRPIAISASKAVKSFRSVPSTSETKCMTLDARSVTI